MICPVLLTGTNFKSITILLAILIAYIHQALTARDSEAWRLLKEKEKQINTDKQINNKASEATQFSHTAYDF